MPNTSPTTCTICLGHGTADDLPGADSCYRCRGTGHAPACLECFTELSDEERRACGHGPWQCAPCCEFEAAEEREYVDDAAPWMLAVAS